MQGRTGRTGALAKKDLYPHKKERRSTGDDTADTTARGLEDVPNPKFLPDILGSGRIYGRLGLEGDHTMVTIDA